MTSQMSAYQRLVLTTLKNHVCARNSCKTCLDGATGEAE